MQLARVTGTVTATVKQAPLTGLKLLLTDVIDGAGAVLNPSVVAADTCGAGVGDTVLVVLGSAARLPGGTAGVPLDAAIVAIVDEVDVPKPPAKKTTTASKRRKS